MKNTQKVILGIIGVIIIAVIGVWGFDQNKAPIANNNQNTSINKNTNTGAVNQETTIQTSLQIDRQDGSTVKVFSVKMGKDSTALAQLQKAAADNNIAIEIKTSDFGSYVNAIDGLSGVAAHYWNLSVNGKASEVGASDLKLKEGDIIEWKYTKV